MVDAVRQAQVSGTLKRDVLNEAYLKKGAHQLLKIGQGIRQAEYDPLWHAALCSASPGVLFEKWQRFETYAHSDNRVRITQRSQNQATFGRYCVDGSVPSAPENLLICGLFIGILQQIGCSGMHCTMALKGDGHYTIFQDGHFVLPENTHALFSASWVIEWRDFLPQRRTTECEAVQPDPEWLRYGHRITDATLIAAARQLRQDITRQWKVAELAQELGLSVRSLQRKLRKDDFSFSLLVQLVRIHEACRLLKDSDTPITLISFYTGFCDSAHFAREFRACTGMTPSRYRVLISYETRKTASTEFGGPE